MPLLTIYYIILDILHAGSHTYATKPQLFPNIFYIHENLGSLSEELKESSEDGKDHSQCCARSQEPLNYQA